MNNDELRELEIDQAREHFESACGDIAGKLAGYDASRFEFDYDDVCYVNLWVDACWQSYIKGRQFSAKSQRISNEH